MAAVVSSLGVSPVMASPVRDVAAKKQEPAPLWGNRAERRRNKKRNGRG
jgi:hypothetical protein